MSNARIAAIGWIVGFVMASPMNLSEPHVVGIAILVNVARSLMFSALVAAVAVAGFGK